MIKKLLLIFIGIFLLFNSSFAKGKIKPCLQEYTLAVLPVVNLSGLDQRTLEAVSNAIKDELKKKYPPKKTKVRFIANDAINEVMAAQPFENSEAPTLKELVDVGNSLGADRVMFISLMSSNDKESGFMVIVGAGTIRANVTMKQKLVDVNKGTFIYNANTVSKGASNSVNFWRIGSPSKIRAVKKSVANAMKQFLMSFDQDGD